MVLIAVLVAAFAACGDTATETTIAPPTTTPPATSTIAGPTTTAPSVTTQPAPTTTTTTTSPPPTTTQPPEPAGRILEVTLAGGEVIGPGDATVKLGETVRIEVTSDAEDEVHLHGYDLFAAIGPGIVGVVEFSADIPGIFEVELEGSHVLLFELTVEP